jgi:hypothetical protein
VAWQDGKLVSATVKNVSGDGNIPVRYGNRVVQLHLQPGETKTLAAELL